MTEVDLGMLYQLISPESIVDRLFICFTYWSQSLTVEPVAAGVLASVGSVFGKLSGLRDVVGDSYIVWALMLILMVIFNTWGCRCYLRALDASPDTVRPTVISSAVSYLFSALIEVKFFDGNMSLRWWIGNMFILQGIALLADFKLPNNDDGVLSDSNNNGNSLDDDENDGDDDENDGDDDENDGDDADDDGGDADGDDYGRHIVGEGARLIYNIERFFPMNDEQMANNIQHYFKDRRRLG